METKSLFTIKTDKKVKEAAQKAAAEIGVPLSTVVNAFLRQFARDKEVMFSARSYQMTPYLEQVIASAERDIKNGKNISPKFKNAASASAYLRS